MNFLFRLSAVFLTLFMMACSEKAEPPTTAPANVTVSAGENLAALNWDTETGRTYWVFYKAGTSVSLNDADQIIAKIEPPYLVKNLDNGTQYALAITSSINGSRVGPFSSTVTATPRLLGPAIPWTVGTALTANDLRSVAFGNDKYVTVGNAGTVFTATFEYLSPGAVSSWVQPTTIPVTAATNLVSVVYNGLHFVALGDDGTVVKSTATTVVTDTNVATWDAATDITGATSLNAMAYNSRVYVAVGDAGEIYTNTTADLSANWTTQASGTTNDLLGVAYVDRKFIAVGAQGTLLTSPDGSTWTVETSNTTSDLHHVAFGVDTYVAVGDAGTIISSADATSWTVQALVTAENLRSISFGPSEQFKVVGTTGTILYSTTGADGSWSTANAGTNDLNSIVPNTAFIAVGAAGANVSAK